MSQMDECLPDDELPTVSPGIAMGALSEPETKILLEWINESSPFTEAQLVEHWKPGTPQDYQGILKELVTAEWIIKVPSEPEVKYYLSSDPYFFALRRRLILCHRSVGNLLQEAVSTLSNGKILKFEMVECASQQLFEGTREVSNLITLLARLVMEVQEIPVSLRLAGANLADPNQIPALEAHINAKWEETEHIHKALLDHLKVFNDFKIEEQNRPKPEPEKKVEKPGFSKLFAQHSIPPMEPHREVDREELHAAYQAQARQGYPTRESVDPFFAYQQSPAAYYGQRPHLQSHPNYPRGYYQAPHNAYPIREPIRAPQPTSTSPREWSSRLTSADRAFTGETSPQLPAYAAPRSPGQVEYPRVAPWGRPFDAYTDPRLRGGLPPLDSLDS